MQPCVYIMSSNNDRAIYIGVTSQLKQRIWQHKNNVVQGFSSKYKTYKLVFFEMHRDMNSAFLREKRLKKWNRKWKMDLISLENPNWIDLYDSL